MGTRSLQDDLAADAAHQGGAELWGITMTYTRGGDAVTGGLALVPSEPNYQLEVTRGGATQLVLQDFLAIPSDLVLASAGLVEPIVGDVITWTRGTVVETYHVLQPDGLPPFEFDDRYHTRLRIHCRLVARA